jgi:hypothetical protein
MRGVAKLAFDTAAIVQQFAVGSVDLLCMSSRRPQQAEYTPRICRAAHSPILAYRHDQLSALRMAAAAYYTKALSCLHRTAVAPDLSDDMVYFQPCGSGPSSNSTLMKQQFS